ncbi:MAG TPA: hypothetical protein VK191_02030 [Symbiobacteriaceae bacterium]|nr:hypothetical protein [Symbiobacteriaceae bacterium]
MPIRPVDLLSLLPRTAENSRVHGAQEGTAQAFQHALANEGKARLEQKGTQVQATPEGESAKLRTGEDPHQGSKGGAQRERLAKGGKAKETETTKAEEGARPPGVGSRLDIKL